MSSRRIGRLKAAGRVDRIDGALEIEEPVAVQPQVDDGWLCARTTLVLLRSFPGTTISHAGENAGDGPVNAPRSYQKSRLFFHVATALEMWEGRQSLGLTDPLGLRDVTDPPNVRTFIMGSTQHGPAGLPLPTHQPLSNCQQQSNPNPQLWTMRALLSALTAWVLEEVPPPQSAVPHIADRTLVPPDQVHFPEIPASSYGGVERPAVSPLRIYDSLHVLDYGPLYHAVDSSGIITREPPLARSPSYGILEMQVDADGNDVAGIELVFSQVPIGTYTGWNLFRKDHFENGLCNLQGSFIPFAPTRAERLAIGDPRPSIEERYPTKESHVAAIRKAANGLVAKRYLLREDADP